MEDGMETPQKPRNKTTNDPEIPQLEMYSEETKIEKDTCTPMFILVLFTIARTWKQPKCPLTDEWIKRCGAYTQWNITQPQKGMKLDHLQGCG